MTEIKKSEFDNEPKSQFNKNLRDRIIHRFEDFALKYKRLYKKPSQEALEFLLETSLDVCEPQIDERLEKLNQKKK